MNYYELLTQRQNKQVNYIQIVGNGHMNCEEFQLQCTANRAFSIDLFSLWPSFVVQKLTEDALGNFADICRKNGKEVE